MSDHEDQSRIDHAREILVVRHGKTDTSEAKRIGRGIPAAEQAKLGFVPDHEVPLNDDGWTQAKAAAILLQSALRERGADTEYDVAFDSGYLRARQTLDTLLAGFGLKDRIHRSSHIDLREREPGYFLHMPLTQVHMFFPWYHDYEHVVGTFYARTPGGENVADVCSRVHVFMNSIRRRRCDKRVLVVSHGHVMRGFLYWLDRQYRQNEGGLKALTKIKVDYCAAIRFVRFKADDDRWEWRREDLSGIEEWPEWVEKRRRDH